jgi:hypothetical protein
MLRLVFFVGGTAALIALGPLISPARGATLTTSVTQAVGQDWNAAIWQPGNVSPVAGNTYETVSNGTTISYGAGNTRIRNPAVAGVQTFLGDSLTLNLDTELRMKGVNGTILDFPGVGGNPGFILNGGVVNTGDAGVRYEITGRVLVQQPSIFDLSDAGSGNFSAGRTVTISAILTGSAGLTIQIGDLVSPFDIQSMNNPFSGNWTVNSAYLKGTAVGSLGNGTNSFTLNVTNPGPASPAGALFETDYDLVTTGSLVFGPSVGGVHAMFLLDQNDTFGAVNIEGVSLTPGVYTAPQLIAQFPNNFDPSSTGRITVAIPEPTSIALALCGVAISALGRGRRRERTKLFLPTSLRSEALV